MHNSLTKIETKKKEMKQRERNVWYVLLERSGMIPFLNVKIAIHIQEFVYTRVIPP